MKMHPKPVFKLAFTLLFALVVPAYSADSTWTDGDAANDNWSDTDNWSAGLPSSADEATFNNSGLSPVVLDATATINTLSISDDFTIDDDGSGTPPALTINGAISDIDRDTVVINAPIHIGGSNTWRLGVASSLTLNGQLTGTDDLVLEYGPYANDAADNFLFNADNSGYSGNITLSVTDWYFSKGSNKQHNTVASVANSLGTGTTTIGREATVEYAPNASGGNVVVDYYGRLELTDAPDATDDITVTEGGVIKGDATAFAGATPGGNVTFNNGAIISHSALDQGSVSGLGTTPNYVFGVGDVFNNASATIAAGAGTPWKGFAASEFYSSHNDFQSGTVNIDTTGLSEFLLQALEPSLVISRSSFPLQIGSGTTAPTFALSAGDAVPARILGEVEIDTTLQPQTYAPAFSKWIVDGTSQGRLTFGRSGAQVGIPVEVESEGQIVPVDGTALDASVDVASGGKLHYGINGGLNGTGTINIQSGAIFEMDYDNPDGLTGTQTINTVEGSLIYLDTSSDMDDPGGLGSVASGAIIYQNEVAKGKGALLGTIEFTGQILTRNGEQFTRDAAEWRESSTDTGGISGNLIITAPSDGQFISFGTMFAADLLPGTEVQIGHTDSSFIVNEQEQKYHVRLMNSANDPAKITIAGAGSASVAPSGCVLSASMDSVGSAAIDYIIPKTDGGSGWKTSISGNTDFTGPISVAADAQGLLSLDDNDSETLTLSGGITLNDGAILNLTEASNAAISVSGDLTVGAGAEFNPGTATVSLGVADTLGGTGIVNGNISVDGLLAPGASPGELTVDGDLTIGSTGTYAWEIDEAGNADMISVTGALAFDSETDFTIELTPIGNGAGGDYQLFAYGSYLGDPSTWDIADNGMSYASIDTQDGNSIWIYGLQPIPEPNSFILLALSAVGLLTRRSRRRR